MAAEPVLAEDDDRDIAAELDAAMADIDMDFAPDANAVETPVLDAEDDKEAFQASQEENGEAELRLLEEHELQLDADEFHIDEDELRIDESELELDAGSSVEASELPAEEVELSFDDVDFASELEAVTDEAATDLEEPEEAAPELAADEAAVALEEPEEATPELAADEAEPVMRYVPVEQDALSR